MGPVVEPKVAIQLADKVSFTVPWQSMLARTIERLGAGRKLAGIALTIVDEMKTAAVRSLFIFVTELVKSVGCLVRKTLVVDRANNRRSPPLSGGCHSAFTAGASLWTYIRGKLALRETLLFSISE